MAKGYPIEIFTGIFLEIALLSLLFFPYLVPMVSGGVGENVTVSTFLTVGNIYPEVLNVSVDYGNASITLIANSSKEVICEALIRDWNNESDFSNVYAEFFNLSFGDTDDNNSHYTNSSCYLNTEFGSWNGISETNYTAVANCTFNVQYYADPGEWNCTVVVNDSVNWNATGSDNITVSELLAIALPTSINYGSVNSTYVSSENTTNVTNVGNVEIDLALSGYAVYEGDNVSMNCSLGGAVNISIDYEKYDLVLSTPEAMSLSQFEANYTNLTSSPVTEQFNLNYRDEDGNPNDAINSTYWRIYVPTGVAGTCSGNIVFGAVKST